MRGFFAAGGVGVNERGAVPALARVENRIAWCYETPDAIRQEEQWLRHQRNTARSYELPTKRSR
jgi:hypothetical protein